MQTRENGSHAETYRKILKAEKMTPERLRAFPGFEEIKEDEAKHVIETLECFCGIIVKHISKKEDYEEP
ncbi:hypothetical protein [Gaetbulibacter jejuensis]|jgi:hypothetical protein|uniref:hypothetical protein n=1 Tax=Gaetbulibacter jejuensis TaxID=584607 RepID=UPI0030096D16|nr:hypothetical protein [Flavobacteriales bacterium]